MKKTYYDVFIKTIDGSEFRLRTEQTHDEIVNYNGNYGMICIDDEQGIVYTFALKNIIVLKHC